MGEKVSGLVVEELVEDGAEGRMEVNDGVSLGQIVTVGGVFRGDFRLP